MTCSECKVFLPRDSPTLDAHWQQYHSNLQTTEESRFFEKQVCAGLSELQFSNAARLLSPVKCLDCEVEFDNMNKFKIHQGLEHPEVARVSCPICLEKFSEEENPDEHEEEERHENETTRPYQCEICGSSYKTRNTLYIHKRLSHLNQKFPSTNRKRTKEKPVKTTTTTKQEFQEQGEFPSLL